MDVVPIIRHNWPRMQCPLCKASNTQFKASLRRQEYYQCNQCELIFVPAEFHVSAEREKQQYLNHHNGPHDQGYCQFLSELVIPLSSKLKPTARGLDFGSGPGPTMHLLFKQRGYCVDNYDPYFAPQLEKLNHQYDFVTATEVVEHFNDPNKSWQHLIALVKPNGFLGVMTLLHNTDTDFENWWYKNDPTHIHFYSVKTLSWIATNFKLSVEIISNRVAIFGN